MNKKEAKLTEEESRLVDDKLLKGVVSRASTMSFVFAFSFSVYSLSSLSFLRDFLPDLNLFDNTWPRLLFNGLPLLIMGFYFKNYESNFRLKAWLWTLALPLLFLIACLIHVWPIIWSGKPDVYFFVHAANVYILTTALIVVAPPPRMILVQTAGFVLFVAGPIGILFISVGSLKMLQYEMNDLLIVIPTTAYIAYIIHQLRLKIALFDLELRRIASPFLGATLTDAIYNQKPGLLQNRYADALVVQMDIRGYTHFYKNTDPTIVRTFMTSYHSTVSRFVGQQGGYWHKSVGDAQMITFGAMELQDDIEKIPGTENELSAAAIRRKQHHFEHAIQAIKQICESFEELKERFDIDESVGLGIALASGEIEIRVQGDDLYKKELDIDGKVVIRCARLEEYSKTIRKQVAPNSSVLIIAPELSFFVATNGAFHKWSTVTESLQVRSFPEIEKVYYHIFPKRSTSETAKRRRTPA